MDTGAILAVTAAGIVLAFAFTNGFHDAANAIATLVASRAARPLPAILMASIAKWSDMARKRSKLSRMNGQAEIDGVPQLSPAMRVVNDPVTVAGPPSSVSIEALRQAASVGSTEINFGRPAPYRFT